MLNTYFETIVPLLEANGGEVHQIVGDEVMAIFNKQGDTPDHPERAARAALRLQDEAERIAAAHPKWPRFRTGVNSGDVVAAVVGGAERAPQARRRRRHRQPRRPARGGRPPGHGRHRRAPRSAGLPPGAVVERVPPIDVKGKREPVDAYVLLALADVTGTSGG